jgi:hypothetical protein
LPSRIVVYLVQLSPMLIWALQLEHCLTFFVALMLKLKTGI